MATRKYPIIFLAVLAVYFLFFLQKIDLVRADLGRMLKNGETIVTTRTIADTNFYSYTEPAHPVINSHWLSDVFYFTVYRAAGFSGLTLVHALLHVAALFFFLWAARGSPGNDRLAAFFALLSFPLIASRSYVRPEVFSFLFLGVYFFACDRYVRARLKAGRLLWLLPVQVLWANVHFFFWLGPVLALFFAVQATVEGKKREAVLFIFLTLALIAATFVNPHGLKGMLLPLSLFGEHAYIPPECLPLVSALRLGPNPVYGHFVALFFAAAAALVWAAGRKCLGASTAGFLCLIVFGLATFAAARAYPLFGFFFIPAMAGCAGIFLRDRRGRERTERTLVTAAFALLLAGLFIPGSFVSLCSANFGIGLNAGAGASADFFKKEGIRGPVFNNYGIGGYLEFCLFPRERVFVDNRPEAFSGRFMKDEYLAALKSEEAWARLDKKYGFNAVFFHLKMTSVPKEAPAFLERRFSDAAWVPVYIDGSAVILVKRDGANAAVARRRGIAADKIYIA